MKNSKRVPTQVHTRKLDRMVARKNMKKAEISHINKDKADGSFFANHWRDYITV